MNFVKPTIETNWPAVDQELDELEWRLRYEEDDSSDRMAAATVIAAYRQLVKMTEAARRPVIRALRKKP